MVLVAIQDQWSFFLVETHMRNKDRRKGVQHLVDS
jgi:hypothetical protein